MTQTNSHSRFLNLSALNSLSHMRFSTRHRIEGSYSGKHRSKQRGGSCEFVDYREYTPGEDLRKIDWKVLGRSGRPYIRLYQDETNLFCTMLVDSSRSMSFAGRSQKAENSKLNYVQHLATAMSHIIGTQRDQVGLGIASKGLTDLLPPSGVPSHLWKVQNTIENLASENLAPQTDLAGALRDLSDRLTRRGVLIVMSDFLVDDLEPVFANIRLFRHRRWEVVVLHIIHPEEEKLPSGSAYRFEGMEDEGDIDCSPADVSASYEREFEAYAAMVRTLSLSSGCDYRRVSTGVPYLKTLGSFLIER